jgi:hypothetical protein
MYVIQDTELVAKLNQIAQQENRSVEDFLRSIVAQYKPAPVSEDVNERVKALRRRFYKEAREYWQEVGNMERANLSDEALEGLFGGFDEDGIPRFKDELSPEPPHDSLAYLAQLAVQHNFASDDPYAAQNTREIYKRSFDVEPDDLP